MGAGLFCGAEHAGLMPAHAEFASIGMDRANIALVSNNQWNILVLQNLPRHTPGGTAASSKTCAS